MISGLVTFLLVLNLLILGGWVVALAFALIGSWSDPTGQTNPAGCITLTIFAAPFLLALPLTMLILWGQS